VASLEDNKTRANRPSERGKRLFEATSIAPWAAGKMGDLARSNSTAACTKGVIEVQVDHTLGTFLIILL
jgi:hypothetical protein